MPKPTMLPEYLKYLLLFVLVGTLTQVPLIGLVASVLFWVKGRPILDRMKAVQLADTERRYKPMPMWSYKVLKVMMIFFIVTAVLMTLIYGMLFGELMSM